MCQVALPQLFLIDVIIDIDGLSSRVSAQLFDKIPGHSRPEKVSDEPVPATVGREAILKSSSWNMQSQTFCMFLDYLFDASLFDPCSYL